MKKRIVMNVFMALSIMFFSAGILKAQDNADWEELNNYTGTIASNLKIGMTLIISGKDVSGVYFYNKWLQDISIKGKMDDNRGIVLNEYDKDGKVAGIFKGRFLDHASEYGNQPIQREVIEGVWSHPDGHDVKPFRLVINNATYRPIGKGRYYVAGFDNDKDVETFAQILWKSIVDVHKEKVASMIAYPINVHIGGEKVKVKDKRVFVKNYDQIFYKAFYEKIKESVPHNMFAKDIGVMLGDRGEIWIGSDRKGIYVIAINNEEWK